MRLRLQGALLASSLAALVWSAGCLNPRPEDFPSRSDVEGDGNASAGGGSNGADPEAPSNGANVDEPDPSEHEPPGDQPDPANEPEPGPGADAGVPVEADAGRPDGGCSGN
jgi:hypothetical protein